MDGKTNKTFRQNAGWSEINDAICDEMNFIWSADWKSNKAMNLAGKLQS